MSSLAFLVTELQSLASETRRKHPEIREAAEKSLAILRASPEQAPANLASDGPQSGDLLKPVFMGCATKNAKVVAISLGSLQRLITLKAVPQSAIPLIITTMSDAMSQGVDIQLRILQTLVSLVPNFPAVHGELLGDALLLCFKLQESRIAVVSSTAAATLRQLVMFVFDKMIAEDRQLETPPADQMSEVILPDGDKKSLGPSARDAFSVFEDLCLLANSEKPHFLKLESLHKTFALELIESVLTNYHELFRQHPELVILLRHHLCPLLLKALSDRPHFPLMLRCTRVVFLLLKQFSAELHTETEIFFMLLIRLIAEDGDSGEHGHGQGQGHGHGHASKTPWVRVMAMEIMRGLCTDAELMRHIYDRYDSQDSDSNVFGPLVTALKRLITEKPALLGVGAQMGGVGVYTEGSEGGGVSSMAGRVAGAAVSGVVGMMGAGTGPGLSAHGSSMKLQCIDQLDKADAPPIPESYIYLLAVQCIVSLCDGLFSFVGPIYTSHIRRINEKDRDPHHAPGSIDLSTIPPNEPTAQHLRITLAMIDNGWPALLAALSFVISTNLSDELFVDVLGAYKSLIDASGVLGLTTPRDALFTSLAKFAVPTRVVSSLDSYMPSTEPPPTPRSVSVSTLSADFGLGGGPTQPPGLSERNMACLKVFIASAMFLAGSLGESWFQVLEVLQNADYVLTGKGMGMAAQSPPAKRNSFSTAISSGPLPSRAVSFSQAMSSSSGDAGGQKHIMLTDLEPQAMQAAIQRLFDASKNLDDSAFKAFIDSLCRLSAAMIGMQTGDSVIAVGADESTEDVSGLSPKNDAAHRRRVSGIHIPRTLRSGDFGISKLGIVALQNIPRFIYRSPDVAWNTTTGHLLSIIRLSFAPQPVRVQAARVLDEILLVVPRNITTAGETQGQVQRRVLEVLSHQIIPDQTVSWQNTTTSVELRRMGLDTLQQILQASGHTLVVGWEIIFQMLESVCKPIAPVRSNSSDSVSVLSSPPQTLGKKPLPIGLGNPSEKSYAALVKIAFQCLTLVCDSVPTLSPEHLRMCISTLGQFGRQSDTNIALTSAASLLWSVSDVIQSKRKHAEEEPEYSELWMFLLLEELGLCTDSRPEVRDGAIQTLFRTMQLYGSTLSLETWEQCVWKITFPLIESLTAELRIHAVADLSVQQAWDESKIHALQSVSSIFNDFLVSKIMHLESFSNSWDVFVNHIQESVLFDNRRVSAPALRCLEKAIKASVSAEGEMKERLVGVHQRVWEMIDEVGESVLKRSNSQPQSSPPKLVTEERPYDVFTQESLVAFVDVILSVRSLNRALTEQEWNLERLTRLMAILKGVLTYPNSPDYRPDIDALSPVQAVVMDAITGINILSTVGSPSLIMKDLAAYTTLPFLAAFDLEPAPKSQSTVKRVTYIALSKKTMPLLVDMFFQFKDSTEVYLDGTLESVLSAYSIPIKLKYDCPAPSKFGKDLPLWKTATTCFLRIVKECTTDARTLRKEISDDRIEGIWRQILGVFEGGILSDCSAAEGLSLETQEVEENFDLALLASLENDVVPLLGDSRIPDILVSQLARILQQGSHIYESDDTGSSSLDTLVVPPGGGRSTTAKLVKPLDVTIAQNVGNTNFGSLVPRERFSYWCFDLLFLICSKTTDEHADSQRRLAALSMPPLLNRCRGTLVGFVADEALRGNLPFPRAREEELLYVLRKLLELRLWPGSLWAALSDDPSKYCATQPAFDVSTNPPPSEVISDAVRRSVIGHLFYFYPALCEIATIPRRTPSTYVKFTSTHSSNPAKKAHLNPTSGAVNGHASSSGIEELDAKRLARMCLLEVGKEMGVSR